MSAQKKFTDYDFRVIMELTKEEKTELLEIWKTHISCRKEGYPDVDERENNGSNR